jgi:tetratricopeptide (TPR) repeat protein
VLYDTGQRGSAGREVIFHEYLHFLLHNSAGFIYPAWYNEGIADLYSTITEIDGAIEFGRVPTGRAHTLVNAGWIPTGQLLKFDYRAPDFRSHRVIPQFYAQSWLMAHYFFIGNAERGRQLKEYLAEINQGSSTEDATRAAFGVDAEKLHGEFRRYWENGRIPLRRVRFDEPLPTLAAAPVKPLTEAKAQAFLGYVSLQAYGDRQRAAPFFERALKSDPGEPLALAGMAAVKEAAGNVEEATALLQSALSYPEAPMARLLAADLLFDRADYTPGEKDPGAQGAADGRKAQELYESLLSDPVVGDQAKFGYARASMLLDEPAPEEVLAVVRPAAGRLPTNIQLASIEAALFMRVGNFEAARVAAERAVRFAGSLEQRKAMQSQLDHIDRQLAKEASGGADR